ncbi:MAG TPA: TatD family hydrolase [Mycobacteriales bacterium]|nr:TatD family hydrolase [Mycobacteriales bacterium]
MTGPSHRTRPTAPPPSPEPLPGEVFDSHCHLDAMGCREPAEVAAAVALARAVGVRRVVTVGDTVESSEWCVRAAGGHPDVYAAVAVHPNEVGGIGEAAYQRIRLLAENPRVRAIGETGLDYYWGRVDPAAQQEAFRRHIAIAKQTHRALVIHDRDAHEDVLRILAEEGAPEWTVFHCFSGNADMAGICVDRGYVLSFAGPITFTNAPMLREAVRVVPIDQLLVETDAPFLTPHPHRGRPNGPQMIPLIVRAICMEKRVELGTLCAAISVTGQRVFGAW